MRTTVAIDDELLDAAKKQAHSKGITLGQLVEEALRREIAQPLKARVPFSFPVFARAGTGTISGIDPSSNRDLFDALDSSGDVA